MRLCLLAAMTIFSAVLVDARAPAKAGPWCAWYDASTFNCGFSSFPQCLATLRGIGGYCAPNYYEPYVYVDEPPARRVRRKPKPE